MTRLDKIIKGFNDYDNFVKKHISTDDSETYNELNKIRNEVSMLIGELKRFGCRRKK